MDKKELAAIVQNLVEEVAKSEGYPESVARAVVGITIQRNKAAFLRCAVLPKLVLDGPKEPEEDEIDQRLREAV